MKIIKRLLCCSTVFSLFFPVLVLGGQISSSLFKVLGSAAVEEEIPVIIQLKNQVQRGKFKSLKKNLRKLGLLKELRQQAMLDQVPLKTLLNSKKNKKLRSLWIINGLAATATAAEIQSIASRPEVAEVRYDAPITFSNSTLSASSSIQWNIAMLEAQTLWAEGIMGQGVVIASMDTGVDYLHSQLSGNWRGGSNSWFDPHNEHALPYDPDGHGTQTMGIMAGQNLGAETIGMAPLAQWISVKIFNDAGQASLSDIHAGYQWLLDPDSDPNTDDAPHIVNNSWGLPDTLGSCDTEFAYDIQLLRDMGIAVVFSAGNLGSGPSSISPANNAGVFSVGAVNESKIIINSSSNGPSACDAASIYPTAVAPGYLVNTSDLTLGGIFPNATTLTIGTSFAAPHVTGALALLLSFDPNLSMGDLETALIYSAHDQGVSGADFVYGNGLINVADAFAYLTGVPLCTDSDGDGSFVEPACNIDFDCNDADAFIYPGAPEIALDSMDQDCNGYDLSIVVTKAVYNASTDKLTVHAESSLGKKADLLVDIEGIGTRKLHWRAAKKRWQKKVKQASQKGFPTGEDAKAITVYGKEGWVIEEVTLK